MKRFRDTNYYVTEDGRVFNSKKELKGGNCRGYKRLLLSINKKTKQFLVHRMVAECYIPNPENKLEVNHKNGIKTDNRIENLEWNTRSENMNHKHNILNKCIGESHFATKLSENDISYIRKNYIPRHKEFGGVALSKKFKVKKAVISTIINNKTWKHIKQ